MTYVTINIEIETLFPYFGATKNDLRLIIFFRSHENIVTWAKRSYLIFFDQCLMTYSNGSLRKWNSYLDLDMVIRSIL